MLPEKHNRNTRQRQVILDELKKVHSHPTADELYENVRKVLPHISLGTVYRNLEILSDMGLIQKLEMFAGQKRFDGDIRTHYHAKCLMCGRIFDISAGIVKRIEFEEGYTDEFLITGFDLNFTGMCKSCSEVNRKARMENKEKTISGDRLS